MTSEVGSTSKLGNERGDLGPEVEPVQFSDLKIVGQSHIPIYYADEWINKHDKYACAVEGGVNRFELGKRRAMERFKIEAVRSQRRFESQVREVLDCYLCFGCDITPCWYISI